MPLFYTFLLFVFWRGIIPDLKHEQGLSDSASTRQTRSGREPDPLWDVPDPLWASRTSKAHILVFEPSQ